jgi:DNA-binding transcriptional ArsR family regulator
MAHEPSDAVFAALADPTRRSILRAVAERGPVTATALSDGLPISRQAVAKHLTALRGAELVTSTRVGRETHYKLHPQRLDEAAHWIQMVSAEWDDRLEALRRSLEKRRSRTI